MKKKKGKPICIMNDVDINHGLTVIGAAVDTLKENKLHKRAKALLHDMSKVITGPNPPVDICLEVVSKYVVIKEIESDFTINRRNEEERIRRTVKPTKKKVPRYSTDH